MIGHRYNTDWLGMKKQFQMVCGLWVTPDFTEVMAGRTPPPRVNHSRVDFAALRAALLDLFPYGPPITIQVPNDTIDQVSVYVRVEGAVSASMRCEDFGHALLKSAKRSSAEVVDVRSEWAALHALPDREFAPPPIILPFVVTARDFEDAMIWQANTRPRIGLKVFDPFNAMQASDATEVESGTLPPVFRGHLAEIFGSPFQAMAVLDRMAMDKPPQEYGL